MKPDNRTYTASLLTLAAGLVGLACSDVVSAPPPIEQAPEEPTCQELAAAWREYPDLEEEEVSESTFEKESDRRPCLKSYPWPEGEFLDDDPESGMKAVSSERMREIQARVRGFRARYSAATFLAGEEGATQYLAQVGSDTQGLLVGYRLANGMDEELLERFGEILHFLILRREGDLQRLLSDAESLIRRENIKPGPTSLDNLEGNTYFSEQFQKNLILHMRFSAIGETGTEMLEEGLAVLRAFLAIRELLRPQIQMFGDPSYLLFENAGCEAPVGAY